MSSESSEELEEEERAALEFYISKTKSADPQVQQKRIKVSSKHITDPYGVHADDRMVSDMDALEIAGHFENLFR